MRRAPKCRWCTWSHAFTASRFASILYSGSHSSVQPRTEQLAEYSESEWRQRKRGSLEVAQLSCELAVWLSRAVRTTAQIFSLGWCVLASQRESCRPGRSSSQCFVLRTSRASSSCDRQVMLSLFSVLTTTRKYCYSPAEGVCTFPFFYFSHFTH